MSNKSSRHATTAVALSFLVLTVDAFVIQQGRQGSSSTFLSRTTEESSLTHPHKTFRLHASWAPPSSPVAVNGASTAAAPVNGNHSPSSTIPQRWRKSTKQVATLGPASSTVEMIEQLFLAGADMFRLNFSHGSQEQKLELLQLIRQVEAKHRHPIAILGDLQGPKLRVGTDSWLSFL